jgi:predicted tellurium resistance membrane protein TerC
MIEIFSDPSAWLALITLVALEIVLGIDNIIFISILTNRLPQQMRARARTTGLGLAMMMRIGLLLSLSWLMGLSDDVFTFLGQGMSSRDLILLGGGLFLLGKSTREVHNSMEGEPPIAISGGGAAFFSTLVQIALIDIVFSLDSVITAIGLVDQIEVMVIAIVISVLVMMFAARPISTFVEQHPTVKMLALSFLMLIGLALIGESLDAHIPKGYIYFAMAFSFSVEMLNVKVRGRDQPVNLRKAQLGDFVQLRSGEMG